MEPKNTPETQRLADEINAHLKGTSGLSAALVGSNPALFDAIGKWLIAKGVDHIKASSASAYVRANAFNAGDRYVKTMLPDYQPDPFKNISPNRNYQQKRRGRVETLNLGDDVIQMLNEKPEVEELERELEKLDRELEELEREKLDFQPEIEPERPLPAPQVDLDPNKIARLIAPHLGKAISELRREITNESTNVRGDLDRAIDRRWTEAEMHFQNRTKGLIDSLKSDIFKYIDEQTPRRIDIYKDNKKIVEFDQEPRHKIFDKMLKLLLAGEHLYGVGPAGSGKTHLFKQLAKALGKNIYLPGQALSKYDISGHKGPTGEYFGTVVRDALELGGLLCIDEGDMWAAAALGFLNAPLANGWCAFPDKTIEVHPDFQCIIMANTYGRGATQQYIGRNPLDAASLDRFAYVEVDYDYDLEATIYGAGPWTKYVQRVRDAVMQLKLQHVVSMRATSRVHNCLKVGMSVEDTCFTSLWRGLAPDTISKIKSLAGEPPRLIVEVPINEEEIPEAQELDSNYFFKNIVHQHWHDGVLPQGLADLKRIYDNNVADVQDYFMSAIDFIKAARAERPLEMTL